MTKTLQAAAQAPEITDAMVDAYLAANTAYWVEVDAKPWKPGVWRNGTPREATRVSLAAALATVSDARAAIAAARQERVPKCDAEGYTPYHYTSQLRSMAGGLRMQDNDYAKIAADNLELYAAAFEFFLAAPKPDTPEQATPDQVIDLACALEQRRALHIVAEVAALQIGGADSQTPTPFQAGYALACEEICTRLRTQQWELCGVPSPLPPAGSAA